MENSGQNSPTGGIDVDGAEFMLFGVRVRFDPMRKSVSLNDLSQYEVIPQKEPAEAGDGNGGGGGDGGYASADDAIQRQSSGSGRERKRGVPWTEEEHKLFLLGLQKVGKGDWRGISRNFVKTRTPTQVASHAQKYFLRRNNINRRRRRSSLFDITTESVTADEKFHQKQKFQPLVSPTQLPVAETSIINGPQVFPVIQIDNPMERFTFGHLGQTNQTKFSHQIPVNPLTTQTKMVDLNLSLSLDQVQDQFSRHSAVESLSSFSNGDSMISVA